MFQDEEIIESHAEESQYFTEQDKSNEKLVDEINGAGTSVQFQKKTCAANPANHSRKRKMDDPLVSEAVNTLRDLKERCINTKDPLDKYGEYLAIELRQLETYSAAYVQKLFGDIIFNAKLGYYKQNQNVNVPFVSNSSTTTLLVPANNFPQSQVTNEAEDDVLDFHVFN